jgi:glycosyltransferase involved in cell wall biosynthesis
MDQINNKILRIATVPISLKILTKGQMKFLHENGFEVHAASANGKEIQDLYLNEKIKSHSILPLKRKISPLYDIWAIFKCVLLIKKIKPRIVHTYTPKAGLIGMAAAYLSRVPKRIHNVTGLPLMEATGIKKSILIIVEKLIYLMATSVIVNSFGLHEYILTNILKNKKIEVLGNGSTNGIDIDFFKRNEILEKKSMKIKQDLGILNSDFVWLFIGRLVTDKGINELIIAFNEISSTNKNMKLVLVGNFEQDLDPLKIDTLNIIEDNNKILLVGYKEDVRPYYVLSDCLVFPSYREGLPNVPMQAACFSLPIIATDINGCNEVVIDQINGLLIPPKNSEALKNAMLNLYFEEAERKKMGECTRNIISKKFKQQIVWSNFFKLY